jgi:murein L,D-transpeptidase YcbB/YkuD
MPGVRIERFLASTAVVLFLSGAAGGALAEPKFGSMADASTPAAAEAPPPAVQSQLPPAAQPAEAPSEPPPPAIKPQTSADSSVVANAQSDDMTDRPAPAAAAEETSDQPAANPPSQPTDQPTGGITSPPSEEQPAPAAAETPAATPSAQPVAATGGDEVPVVSPTPPAANQANPAEPAAAPTPTPAAPAVAEADAPIAEQLRELANGKFDRFIGGKKERPAFEAFYAAHNYAPIWITDGKVNARAKEAMAYLGQVDADGLDPADYPVPNFATATSPAALADAEMRLTASVVTYAHHASIGRVHWSRVSGDILYELKAPAPVDVLAAVADAKDVAALLAGFEPQAPNYIALKAKLAELRAGKMEAGKTPIPPGPAPRIGAVDDRVPQLRERFGLGGDSMVYDKEVADAVRRFQQEHELRASGLLTPQTLDALNGRQPDRPIDIVLANMERWRWMPHDLGKSYVIVNLPDYTLRVFHDGEQVWMTRIVAGKPTMATPIMTAEMKFITVNPTWNVPPSIVAHEYMPALAQDPTVLARMGLRVSTNPDGTIHISQPPGDANALGRLRFNFPNKFLVYQHDTPNKNFFALDKRALSHGCMRVQDPVKYAEVLLSIVRPGEGYTQERIRKMFTQGEQDIQFPHYMPVHLTYQTAFVDEEGNLQFRDDVYGRDKALLAILKGPELKVADIPVEHRVDSVRREALALPDQQSFFGGFGGGGYGGRGYSDGGFFSHVFGWGGESQQPPQRSNRRAAQRRQVIQ